MIITIDHTCGMDLAHLDEWAIPSCNNGLLQIESEIGSFTRTVSASTVFFKKWDNLGLFFIYFRAFQTNNTIFNKKSMWKMSYLYTLLGFKPMTFWTRVVTHNHSTRAPTLLLAMHQMVFIKSLYFRLLHNTVDSICKFCRWSDSNSGRLVLEATTQLTEPLPHGETTDHNLLSIWQEGT